MKKRLFNPAIFILILIVLSSIVIAAHTATVSLVSYAQNYETNNMQFAVRVENNLSSANSITNITVFHPGYAKTFVLNPSSFSNDGDINWYGGLISSDGIQTFRFNATAQQVSADTPFTWTITTIDNIGTSQANTLSVTILNDSIPPNITSITPNDYSFVKNDTVNFNINVQELETSLPNNFSLGYADSNSMTTGGLIINSIQVNKGAGNTYSASWTPNQNLKSFIDYRAENLSDAAGNVYDEGLNLPHHLYIDKQYPSVVLNQPENNLLTNQYLHNITFNMTDNSFETNGQGLFNPQVNCTANVGANNYGPQTYTNNVTNGIFAANLTGLADGSYLFNIQCTDKAGYVSTTVTRTILLDTTGPVISLISPANNSIIINGTNILINVTDSPAGVGSIWFDNGSVNTTITSTIDTSNWNEGANNIIVYATDTLNNIARLPLTFTVDKTPPNIQLLTPVNNTITTNNPLFTFNASDNFASTMNCEFFVNNSNLINLTANNNLILTVNLTSALSPDGNYEWNVRCSDSVLNYNISEKRTVIIDALPPTLSYYGLAALENVNDDDGNITFNFNVTDINAVSSCSLYVDSNLVDVNSSITNITNSFNFSVLASNNPYNVSITCNDTVNNQVNSPVIQTYYDNITPVISGVLNSSITDTSVIITWDTNELSDSNLTLNGVTILDNSRVLNHSISISSLTQLTQYVYNVTSRDRWNNTASVLNLNFNTTATPPIPPGPSPSSSSGGGGGGGGSSGGINETIVINTGTANISKAPSTPVAPKEEPKTVIEESEGGSKFTGLTIMDNLKSSIPLALIAGIITLIILMGLYRITNGSKRLNPSMHKHINMEYRQEEVKDSDVFED